MSKTLITYIETDVGEHHFLVDGDYSDFHGMVINVCPANKAEREALHLLHDDRGDYNHPPIENFRDVDYSSVDKFVTIVFRADD